MVDKIIWTLGRLLLVLDLLLRIKLVLVALFA